MCLEYLLLKSLKFNPFTTVRNNSMSENIYTCALTWTINFRFRIASKSCTIFSEYWNSCQSIGAYRCICIKSLSLWWFWETKFYLLSGYIFRFKKSFSNYSYELWPLFITRRRKMLNFREKNLCCGIVTWNH